MTKNLACIILNHKWVEPSIEVFRYVDGSTTLNADGAHFNVGVRQQLMAVCSRDNCTERVWEYV